MSLITTHYSGITARCRKIRVRGIDTRKIGEHLSDLNTIMDYSFVEDASDSVVPHDALTIAKILGTDHEFLASAQEYLKRPMK